MSPCNELPLLGKFIAPWIDYCNIMPTNAHSLQHEVAHFPHSSALCTFSDPPCLIELQICATPLKNRRVLSIDLLKGL